ncbi:hypothetical protein, partial [Halosimplex halobium]|uniref:hypothetical protein n=1 Tax=Halosimplex halobium TaxID=3396618 RepID=UPI003F553C0A
SVSSVLKTCSTVALSGRTELVVDTSDSSYRFLVRTSAPPPLVLYLLWDRKSVVGVVEFGNYAVKPCKENTVRCILEKWP